MVCVAAPEDPFNPCPRPSAHAATPGDAALKAEQLAADQAKSEQLAEDKSSTTGAKAPSTSIKAAGLTSASGASQISTAIAPAAVSASWPTFSATVMSDAKVMKVPATFLATSHEWDRITDYADNMDAFKPIFQEFGPSPILRMGGASQDFLTEVPKKEIW